VRAFLFRRLVPQPDIDDLSQEVFASAFGSIEQLREPSALRPWLLSITVNRLREYNRGQRRNRWLSFAPFEKLPEPTTSCDEQRAKLRSSFKQLAPDERNALVLHRLYGMTLRESAEVSGMSVATFKRRLSRGETRLFTTCTTLATWVGEENAGL
jgi:RNA polymerase sigma-70 factor, ECF subfamily